MVTNRVPTIMPNVATGFPLDGLFEPYSNSNKKFPAAPVLSAQAKAVLNSELPALSLQQNGTHGSKKHNVQQVKLMAAIAFDACRYRKRKAAVGEAVTKALSQQMKVYSAIRKQCRAAQKEVKYQEYKSPERRMQLLRLDNWPNLVALLIWTAACLTTIGAELFNSVSYVLNSGLTDSRLAAGTIGISYVVLPLAVFHYLMHRIGPLGRRRINLVFTVVALPAAMSGIYLFATTLGRLQQPSVFDAQSADTSFEKLILTSAVLLPFSVISLSTLMADAFRSALDFRIQESPVYQQRAAEIEHLDRTMAEVQGMLTAAQCVIDEHSAARAAFIDASVLEFHNQHDSNARQRAND
ncbi:MAG: hypothetical protein KDB23_02485 [Planctomycetales bacterium]|nr:hypothetical protein [Planctomycetales bacterium]